MYDDLGLLDKLYSELYKNEELIQLLGNPSSSSERNERIRREITPIKFATADNINFISMYFGSGTETNNIYVIRGFLHVDYFTKNREEFRKIQIIVKAVFEQNYLLRVSFSNEEAYTKGIFCYGEKYRPLVFA